MKGNDSGMRECQNWLDYPLMTAMYAVKIAQSDRRGD